MNKMKIKTSRLTGVLLDWAVAVCENLELDENKDPIWFDDKGWLVRYSPSTDWSQGGPIIEQEDMKITRWDDYPNWTARHPLDPNRFSLQGDTPLIASMRCYVASKLGDEVEVPEELLRGL